MGARAGDRDSTVVEECHRFACQIKAKPPLSHRQAPLILEATYHSDVGRVPLLLEFPATIERGGPVQIFIAQGIILQVVGVDIRHKLGYACSRSSLNSVRYGWDSFECLGSGLNTLGQGQIRFPLPRRCSFFLYRKPHKRG